jgi:O-antigen/teichoic acid export membrane protein
MTDNSKRKIINALSWSFIESIVMRGIQFIIGVILARLLFPEQFGLIGMLLIFIALARTFAESGFGAALIQKRDATQIDICSIFYFNLFVGLMAAGLLILAAPWIARFYNQPVLTPLMRVLSLTIVINSFAMIQENLLYREINFKAQTLISLIAGLLSGGVGIGFALAGFGVWSLAIQQVSVSFFRAVCLWVVSPWRPAAVFSLDALRKMFGFSSRLLFTGLLNQVFDNIYYLVIGKLFSAGDLGRFTRARTFQDLPSQTLADVVGRVAFPVFSRCQDDSARLKRGLKKISTAMAMLNFPLMIGLAATAHPFVMVLLGQKWTGCVPYLQSFCALGLMYPLFAMNLKLLESKGRSDLTLRLQVINRILTVVGILITWRWGISAMILGLTVAQAVSFYFNCVLVEDLIDYSPMEYLRDLAPYFMIATLMGVIVFFVGLLRLPGNLLMLSVQGFVGTAVYLSLCWVLQLSAFVEVKQEVHDRLLFLKVGAQGPSTPDRLSLLD